MAAAKFLPLDQAERAYEAVNGLFACHQNDILEIEILPSLNHDAQSQSPAASFGILEDESCAGIPKDTLTMAYLHAKQLFFKLRDDETGDQHVALEATRVMLLFDPEHITAANFRKKTLVNMQQSRSGGGGEALHAVIREILFLNGILTSPLHRQSKSPTLWYHRAWLLENFLLTMSLGSEEDLASFVHAELTAVFTSGERHPKNYYAWQYARRLWSLICINCEPNPARRGFLQTLASKCVTLIAEWCRKHPSDISGWSFLAYMLPSIDSVSERITIVSQVLDYAVNINWQGESLWWFIRTSLAEDTTGDGREALMRKMGQDQDGEKTVARALDWAQRFKAEVPES